MEKGHSMEKRHSMKEKYSMKKYSRKNLRAIQVIVQEKTGAAIIPDRKLSGHKIRQMALLAGSLLCFVMLCAFAYAKFSDLNGDVVGFAPAYQGGGRFEIVITNESDRELKLQDKVKVMQWSTGEEVEGDSGKIRMTGLTIAPHSQGIVSIDISEGYDVEAMEENLQEKDWYYFVLTNNNFAFGQDWMCSFDFEIEQTEDVMVRSTDFMEQRAEGQKEEEKQYGSGELIFSDWIWPTVSRKVSGLYGKQANGTYSDHVNIAGTAGDEIYAVADGVVLETAFESTAGNFIIVDLEDGVTVKYGYLKEIKVSEGEEIKQGQVIAALGQTGMATGPNLLFAVSINGEKVNPFVELIGSSPENDSIEAPGNSSDREISEILAACADTRIEQTIKAADGTSLLISADVNVEGITRVSQYEYVLTDITEKKRADLFKSVFPETADQAEYDERNDVWTLDIDPAIRNYFLYLISYSNGGATIPGEQIIMFENRYYDLYPFEDNRLGSVSDSRVRISLDEAERICRRVVDSITDTEDYAVDFVHAYGNSGRRPYLKLVFKRMLDGMPVTTYNDLAFLFDNDGIEKVSGSLFSVKEIWLDKKLLSPKEAVGKLQEQAALLNFEGEGSVAVTGITLEYVVVISPDGKILVTPVWRFLLGEDEDKREFLRQKILGIDALTGEVIWEERGNTL